MTEIIHFLLLQKTHVDQMYMQPLAVESPSTVEVTGITDNL